jgi:hypothetical protein
LRLDRLRSVRHPALSVAEVENVEAGTLSADVLAKVYVFAGLAVNIERPEFAHNRTAAATGPKSLYAILVSSKMGRPITLLERLSEHALALGAQSIAVEYKDRREWVFANINGSRVRIADFASADAKELLGNISTATRKSIRAVLGGRVCILAVRAYENFGEDAFEVKIDPVPKLDPSIAPAFTAKQGQYLAFIYNYTKIHGQAPAESDLERYFHVSPPAIHEMIKTLERNGLVEKTPGKARSIRLLVQPEHLPRLA